MFKNVGRKLRGIALAFFALMCIASLSVIAVGIVSGIKLNWTWPVIYSIIGASVGFVLSLVLTYMLYGYGTLIKVCEDNMHINAEILMLLRKDYQNRTSSDCNGAPVQAAPPVKEDAEDVKVYVAASDNASEEIAEETTEETTEETVEKEIEATAKEIAELSEIEAFEEAAEPKPVEVPSDADLFSDFIGATETPSPQSSEPRVKRCPSCGNVVRPQANFCNLCGHKMK